MANVNIGYDDDGDDNDNDDNNCWSDNFHQVILWTKEGPKRLRFEAPDKTVTVKQVVYLDVWESLKNQYHGTGGNSLGC